MQLETNHHRRRHTRRTRPNSLSSTQCRAQRQRRGTVLVFVLGILVLVALLGLVLITKTHGEHKRVEYEATDAAVRAATDGVVRNICETLRRDIWGTDSFASYPLTGSTQSATDADETNEPFDAPGPSDRWLASTTPYYVGQVLPDPSDATLFEEDVLAYHRVSYIGSDVLHSSTSSTPFAWADNSRTPSALDDYTSYSDASLEDVQILQTPPALWSSWPIIPGSTTNRTIAQARQIWRSAAHQTGLATVLPGQTAQFPYFDTNADGKLDLYDADGDGIPDSPLSLVLELDSANPNEMHRLYAAVKIVDHSSMLNVNVASSLELPAGGLMFSEDGPTLQRRGQRLTELLLEEVAHPDDWQASLRTADTVSYRSNNDPTPDPLQYDDDIVRRELIGGKPTSYAYNLYGLSDEASLRHRGILALPSLADFDKATDLARYDTIDHALRGSLLWNRYVETTSPFGYADTSSRWNRLNADYEPFGFTTTYEGYDDGVGRGWRSLLQEDQPFAIRRHLFTTVSHAVQPPPAGLRFERDRISDDPAYDRVTLAGISSFTTALPPRDDTARQAYLPGVGNLAMSWPVINREMLPESDAIADWMRVLPIDLNMRTDSADNVPNLKAAFIEYAAAAMYLALDGVGSYQGLPLLTVHHSIPAATPVSFEQNREYLAWQFAVNLADYRDEDDVPTALEWPAGSGQYIFGIEKQPFFTEAYAYLLAGTGPAPTGPSEESYPDVEDKWFYAVELYMPPGWNIPTENLYIRTPDANPGLISLGSFISVNGLAPTLTGGTLSGGPANVAAVTDADHGNYYVLCSSTTNAPTDLLVDATFLARGYQNPLFAIAKNGRGRVELWYSPDGLLSNPLNHMLDMIGPEQSGGPLADNTNSGQGVFGTRPLFILEGAEKQYSLLRSTKGWRFTTGWQLHTHAPLESSSPYEKALRRSLGSPNNTSDSLDSVVPESIWPARVNQVNKTPPGGFYSTLSYETFDSVAELSRMYMIGSLNRTAAAPPYMLISGTPRLPATTVLATLINQGPTGDFPAGGNKKDRVAAGRIDFVDARRISGHPWTERLFQYFTTCHPLNDGIDNDGDDTGDGSLIDWNDPDEGISALYRVAGRININTAPRPVLRSVPYMSLLPTSAEYVFFLPAGSVGLDPVSEFAAHPTLFWDFASAIVAAREDRRVSLRLINAADALQDVAYAEKAGTYDSNGPAADGAFTSIAELARLTQILDMSSSNNHSLFNTQRFWANSTIALTNHKIPGSPNPGPDLGDATDLSPYSPDYRYRGDNGEMDYIPILRPALAPIGQAASNPYDAAGVRGRDIYLSRWTNMLTTRSDCFTAYIALLDENGHYVARTEVTLDRSPCFAEIPPVNGEARRRILPAILNRVDSSYADDTK